jgi:hypothetical protein
MRRNKAMHPGQEIENIDDLMDNMDMLEERMIRGFPNEASDQILDTDTEVNYDPLLR